MPYPLHNQIMGDMDLELASANDVALSGNACSKCACRPVPDVLHKHPTIPLAADTSACSTQKVHRSQPPIAACHLACLQLQGSSMATLSKDDVCKFCKHMASMTHLRIPVHALDSMTHQ